MPLPNSTQQSQGALNITCDANDMHYLILQDQISKLEQLHLVWKKYNYLIPDDLSHGAIIITSVWKKYHT